MEDKGHSFGAYFKRATSPLVVLSILQEKPMYGYEISSEMKRRSNGRFAIAVLYPVLYRLEEQGFVETAGAGRGTILCLGEKCLSCLDVNDKAHYN